MRSAGMCVAVAGMAAALCLGCGRNALQADGGRPGDASSDVGVDVPGGGSLDGLIVIHERLNRKLDLLFMIDNSPSVEPEWG